MKKKDSKSLIIVAVIWFVLWMYVVSKFQFFGDAMEVITGGWFLSKGLLAYQDFFFHKMPLLYYLSVPMHWLGLKNLVFFRIFLFLLYAGLIIIAYQNIKTKIIRSSLLIFLIIFPFVGTVFMHQMWLQNNLAGLVGLLIFTLLWEEKKELSASKAKNIYIIILAFMAFNTSLTSLFFLAPLMIYWWLINKNKLINIFWLIIVNLIFPVYFFIKGILYDYIWSAFIFSNHYFNNRIADQTELTWGKLGFVVYILRHFIQHITNVGAEVVHEVNSLRYASVFLNPLLYYQTVRPPSLSILINGFGLYCFQLSFNFIKSVFNMETGLLMGLVIFFIVLLKQKKYAWFVISFFFLLGSRARVNEVFLLAPYYIFSSWVLCYLVIHLFKVNRGLAYLAKILTYACFLTVIFSSVKSYSQIIKNRDPTYDPYSLEMARDVQNLVGEDDKIWVFGGETGVYFWANRLPANPYYFYYPVLHSNSVIKQKITESLIQEQPKLIVFKHNQSLEDNSDFYASDLFTIIKDKYKPVKDIYYLPK
jgi:hypothetical protein